MLEVIIKTNFKFDSSHAQIKYKMDKFIGLKRIKENNEVDLQTVCGLLMKIIDEILENPNDLTKRNVKLDSLDILMTLSGGMETLFEIGFIEVF